MSAQSGSGFSLTINQHFSAEREAVFNAWTNAEALMQWFAPSDDFKVVVHELDVRVGGKYRIAMHEADGIHIVYGEYIKIDKPGGLVFTWAWEHGDEGEEMLVTVELTADDDGTSMKLLHEKLPSEASREQHNEGWKGCLARLVALV